MLRNRADSLQIQPLFSGPTALALRESCHAVLRETVVSFDDPVLGLLTGWPHFLHESLSGTRPTAIGTAYGLKLALSLDEKDGIPDRSALAGTLWKLRREDGGWAARSQSGISRPEVSALALGALSSVGFESGKLEDAASAFEQSLAAERETGGLGYTNVVSAAIRGLARVKPTSERLAELRASLLAGAIQDPSRGNLLCWSDRTRPVAGQVLIPSVAHTAQAVVALVRASRVTGQDAASRSAVDQAIQWIVAKRTLDNQVEHIRRIITADRWEIHALRHFTSAWVVRAILSAGADNSADVRSLLDEALRHILDKQIGGIWEWDGERPIWMTYQGYCALRDYALYTSW